MARFKLGDRVRISSTPESAFAGAHGTIDSLSPHPLKITQLDSYVVLFSWGERQHFWDAQLEAFAIRETQSSDKRYPTAEKRGG